MQKRRLTGSTGLSYSQYWKIWFQRIVYSLDQNTLQLTRAGVTTNGITSQPITFHRRTRQRCPLSPSLLAFFLNRWPCNTTKLLVSQPPIQPTRSASMQTMCCYAYRIQPNKSVQLLNSLTYTLIYPIIP